MQRADVAISCCPSLNNNQSPCEGRREPDIGRVFARFVLIPDSIGVLREDTPEPFGMFITAESYEHSSTCGGS